MNFVKGNAIGNHLLHKALSPYANKETVYLKEAYRGIHEDRYPERTDTRKETRDCTVIGVFSIPESCYVDESGHFNAVENEFLESFIENLEEFYRKQISDVYISKFESHYKSPINAREFEGICRITGSRKMRRPMYLKTEIGFSDNSGGSAYGSVDLAIVGV